MTTQIKAWWHVSNVNAVKRLEINDHSWVHIQIVTNIALKLLRQLTKHHVEPAMVRDYGMTRDDAEIVVVLGALLHCVGMSVHREGHEDWSLFLAEPKMRELLEGLYDEPERTVVIAEVLGAITSHREDGKPLTLEAGIIRVADALDMAKGRSRIPFEHGRVSIHSLSAAAIDSVHIGDGESAPISIEIAMNNSSGVYQVDELLKAKLRGSGLEPYVEVVAQDRHRGREEPHPAVSPGALRRPRPGGRYTGISSLRGRLMVGRLTLDQVVKVRILAPQPEKPAGNGEFLRPKPYLLGTGLQRFANEPPRAPSAASLRTLRPPRGRVPRVARRGCVVRSPSGARRDP